mmetsp:Transcript_3417/g.8154  ORF Transcript_3417/g.8154 Transcript_3417/m.8154 type:complete len:338 (-) Transcript_3417:1943-2956(-)
MASRAADFSSHAAREEASCEESLVRLVSMADMRARSASVAARSAATSSSRCRSTPDSSCWRDAMLQSRDAIWSRRSTQVLREAWCWDAIILPREHSSSRAAWSLSSRTWPSWMAASATRSFSSRVSRWVVISPSIAWRQSRSSSSVARSISIALAERSARASLVASAPLTSPSASSWLVISEAVWVRRLRSFASSPSRPATWVVMSEATLVRRLRSCASSPSRLATWVVVAEASCVRRLRCCASSPSRLATCLVVAWNCISSASRTSMARWAAKATSWWRAAAKRSFPLVSATSPWAMERAAVRRAFSPWRRSLCADSAVTSFWYLVASHSMPETLS